MQAAEQGALQAKGKAIAPALRALAEATGRPFTIKTKDGRVRIQKALYLLKAAGYPRAQKFEFSIYLSGPYSPELTQVYYVLEDDGIADATPARDVPKDVLGWFSEADANGVEFLEALTTVIDGAKSFGAGRPGLDWAASIKPHIPEATWKEVRRFLRKYPRLIGST